MTVAKLEYISGLDAVVATLKALPDELKKRPIARASLAQARYLQARIKENAPIWRGDTQYFGGEAVMPGTLRDNMIVVRTRTPQNFGVNIRYQIGFRMVKKRYARNAFNRRKRRAGRIYYVEGPAFYARFVERGTSTTGWGRPGQAAQRFMGSTFDAEASASLEVFASTLAKEVERTVAKLARQNASKG